MSTHTSNNPPGLSLKSIIKDFTFFFCNEFTACLNSLYVFLSNEVICTYPILSSLTSLFTLATTISSLFTVTSNCLSPLFIVKTTDVPALPLILLAAKEDCEYLPLLHLLLKLYPLILNHFFQLDNLLLLT